ncbi:hypothetical protein ACFE04_030242 [Oxalis oulophora]
MSFFKLIVLTVTVTVFPSLFILTISESSFDYLAHLCTNETTFTSNSSYHNNLKLILSTLSSSTTYKYYNTTSGLYPHTVHALFLCRGDIPTTTCHDCVNSAAKDLVQLCPLQKEAIIWYDKCFIHYSNNLLVYNLNTASCVSLCAKQNITYDRGGNFSVELEILMNGAANEAAYSFSKFSTKQSDFWDVQMMYSLVQCIPDLSNSDCNSCFDYAIGFLPIQCTEKQGGAVFCPSCNVRYDNQLFYNQTAAAALANSTIPTGPPTPDTSALPLPPSSPVPRTFNPPPNHGNGHIPLWKIIAIVVPITTFFVVLLILWCCFQSSKMKKGRDGKEVKNRKTLQFDFHTIEAATKGFSDENKIGEGGFGIVYWVKNLIFRLHLQWMSFQKGYMPPEYAIRGQFSVKSDVYSFGVIMLEIISGRKNNSFHNRNYADNLLSFAWRHWMNGTALDMMDESLVDCLTRNQVLRCINIGLLSVQENREARPTMASVLFMLESSSSVTLPGPQRPAFYFGHEKNNNIEIELEMMGNNEELKPIILSCSVNGMSTSEICPR